MANPNDPRAQYLQDHAAYVKRLQDQQAAQAATAQQPSLMQRFQNFIGYTPEQFQQEAQTPPPAPAPSMTPYALGQYTSATPPSGIASLPPTPPQTAGDNGGSLTMTGPIWAAENASKVSNAQAAVNQPTQYPPSWKDFSIWQASTAPLDVADKAHQYDKDHAPQKASTANQSADPTGDSPFITDDLTSPDAMPDALPSQGQDTPVQQSAVDPQAQAIADIQRQKAMIDAIYPQRNDVNPAQGQADADMDKSASRTQALAQLAFFSGITQGAGGQWEGVGKGLAAAGQTYSAGFDRYQRALQAKATRAQTANGQKYTDDTARADAAVKLYQQGQTLADKRNTEARQAIKDRQAEIDKYFTTRINLLKGNEMQPTDQGAVDKEMNNWRLSRSRGEIVSNNDVSDT